MDSVDEGFSFSLEDQNAIVDARKAEEALLEPWVSRPEVAIRKEEEGKKVVVVAVVEMTSESLSS